MSPIPTPICRYCERPIPIGRVCTCQAAADARKARKAAKETR